MNFVCVGFRENVILIDKRSNKGDKGDKRLSLSLVYVFIFWLLLVPYGQEEAKWW